ncbi:MAG: hypothetical protein HYU81_02540 [Candidatus Brennerbacteria bacterium]|nr:hypothetical protein [Candidatus Brennerbacteria bacterium]
MPNVKNFHEKLEKDLERVTAEIAVRREHAPEVPAREVVRASIVAAVLPLPADAPAGTSTKAGVSEKENNNRLPSYLSGESPEVRMEVERLVSLALDEGIAPAVAAAAKHPPFVLDAFHDALVDKLMPELERRGIVK